MPGRTPHAYTLAAPINPEGHTAAQMALLYYLRTRELEGKGGATRTQMIQDSHLAERTVHEAVRRLSKKGVIK